MERLLSEARTPAHLLSTFGQVALLVAPQQEAAAAEVPTATAALLARHLGLQAAAVVVVLELQTRLGLQQQQAQVALVGLEVVPLVAEQLQGGLR